MKGYSASDRAAAVRCVDCPACRAAAGFRCRAIRHPAKFTTVTHKRRVDKFFTERYGQMEPKS